MALLDICVTFQTKNSSGRHRMLQEDRLVNYRKQFFTLNDYFQIVSCPNSAFNEPYATAKICDACLQKIYNLLLFPPLTILRCTLNCIFILQITTCTVHASAA